MKTFYRFFLNSFFICCVAAGFSYAEESAGKCPQAIEFLSGYAQAKLHGGRGTYRSVPLIVDLDFDLKPLTQKIGINPPMLFQFVLEPFISPVYDPNANVELGTTFLLKLGLLPDTWKLQPYLKAGAGLDYMTQHTNEQGTQFNFIEYGGVGAHYFLTEKFALTVEGRFRHLSNAGIDDPNHGINSYFALAGIAYNF